jgi:acetyl-CoA carboxylase biotin carboxyl carrier protein
VGTVTPEDLEAFVSLFDSSDWDQVHVEFGDFALHLSKVASDLAQTSLRPAQPHAPSSASLPAGPPSTHAPPPASSAGKDVVPEGWVAVRAPHLGTFYRAPKPGADPFVEVGQSVNAETDVCLLEVMKLFTTLRAGSSGILRRICAKDAQMVESGDLLFLLEPTF